MELFEQALRWTHIVFGFLGLVLFWIPIFARKGGTVHVGYGTWFKRCAYLVLASAGLSVVSHLAQALVAGRTPTDSPSSFGFLIFLGYLAWITTIMIRHGIAVLHTRRDPAAYRTLLNLALGYSCMLASAFVVAYALYYDPPVKLVLFGLSPIGFLVGSGIRAYISNPPQSSKAWFYEHMGAMIGAGIAFHTAFAVFGLTRLFDLGLSGWLAVLPWLLPTLIGVPASYFWTRHYRRRFGEMSPTA
jgi:hypothetical protein